MRSVVLFAFCPSSSAYVAAFADAGAHLAAVVTGPGGGLAEACAGRGVTLWRSTDVNATGFVARVEALAPDLLVVAGCPQLLQGPMLGAARLGTVNLHPSLLPRYRGRQPLFWALLRGEATVGVTLHRATAEIDAGPILAQREVAVPPRATAASLAREVDAAGAALVPDLVRWIDEGALPPGTPQSGPSSRVPPLGPEHGLADWSRSAVELDRLVRAAAGEIAVFTHLAGMKLVLLEAEPADAPAGPPGAVLDVGSAGVVVATGAGALRVTRWALFGRTCSGEELGRSIGLRAGQRLSASPAF